MPENRYTDILRCLTSDDVTCLSSYASSPELRDILSEVEKRGIKAEQALAALALPPGLQMDDAAATLDDFSLAVELAKMVDSGRYLDALRLLATRPSIVALIRTADGKPIEAQALAEQLIFWLLYNQIELIADVQQLADRSELVSKALATALPKLAPYRVYELCNEGRYADAFLFIKRLRGALGDRYADALRNAVAVMISYSDKLGEKDLSELMSMAKLYGLVDEKVEQSVADEASKAIESLVNDVLDQIFSQISEAISKKDAPKLREILANYGQLLNALPLVVSKKDGSTITVGNLNLGTYLAAVALYIAEAEPRLSALTDSINKLNEALKEGNSQAISTHSKAILEALDSLYPHVGTLAIIRYVNSLSNGLDTSVDQARKDIENEFAFYRRMALYAQAVADVLSACNQLSCNVNELPSRLAKLTHYFNDFPESIYFYASYRLAFMASLEDIASLFGLAPSTPLTQELARYGVTVDTLASNQRDALVNAVHKAVASGFFSGDPKSVELANRLLAAAVARGLNGKLMDLNMLIRSLEVVSEPMARLNRLMQKLELTGPRDYKEIIRDYEEIIKELGVTMSIIRYVISMYGNSLSRFEVEVLEGGARNRITMLDLFKQILSSFEFTRDAMTLQLEFTRDMSKIMGFSPSEADISTWLKAAKSAQDTALRYSSSFDMLSRMYGRPVDEYKKNLMKVYAYYKDIENLFLYARDIETNVKEILNLLKDGLQHPEESGKISSRWRTAVLSLNEIRRYHADKSLVNSLVATLGDEAKKMIEFSENMYKSYYKYLSDLKTGLVSQDVRLEYILNAGETNEVRIEYAKPYLNVPVLAPLEKYIKIGIKQVSDWLSRIPVMGQVASSFWEGLAGSTLALLKPYEAWQELQYILSGANECLRKLAQGDLVGVAKVVLTPLYQAVTSDPARFAGSFIGFIALAQIGKGIATKLASKFKMPGLVKLEALITNILQADPLGLVIDYIVGPAVKMGILRLLLIWNITPGLIGSMVKGLAALPAQAIKMLSDVLAPKFHAFLSKVKALATLVYAWGDDISKILKNLEDVRDRKGINYLLAIRNYLLEVDPVFRSMRDSLNDLIRSGKDIKDKPIKALAFGAGLDIDEAYNSLAFFRDMLLEFQRATGIQIDMSKLSKMSIKELANLRDTVRNMLIEIVETMNKFSSAVYDMVDYVKKNYPNVYYAEKFGYLDELVKRSLDPVKSTGYILKFVEDLANEFGPKVAADIAKRLTDSLESSGLRIHFVALFMLSCRVRS
ncbi:MAG: hypothetical protein QXT64_03010, partial [Desulfurococcaceae archaeon]